MPPSVTLGDIADQLPLLEVRCTKCDRHGRYRTATLVERYGRHLAMPDLRVKMSADCGKHDAAEYERCDVFFPALGEDAGSG